MLRRVTISAFYLFSHNQCVLIATDITLTNINIWQCIKPFNQMPWSMLRSAQPLLCAVLFSYLLEYLSYHRYKLTNLPFTIGMDNITPLVSIFTSLTPFLYIHYPFIRARRFRVLRHFPFFWKLSDLVDVHPIRFSDNNQFSGHVLNSDKLLFMKRTLYIVNASLWQTSVIHTYGD